MAGREPGVISNIFFPITTTAKIPLESISKKLIVHSFSSIYIFGSKSSPFDIK